MKTTSAKLSDDSCVSYTSRSLQASLYLTSSAFHVLDHIPSYLGFLTISASVPALLPLTSAACLTTSQFPCFSFLFCVPFAEYLQCFVLGLFLFPFLLCLLSFYSFYLDNLICFCLFNSICMLTTPNIIIYMR